MANASPEATCLAFHAMGEGCESSGLRDPPFAEAGSGGPQVSHKIRDADVALMADGGDHGARAGDVRGLGIRH